MKITGKAVVVFRGDLFTVTGEAWFHKGRPYKVLLHFKDVNGKPIPVKNVTREELSDISRQLARSKSH